MQRGAAVIYVRPVRRWQEAVGAEVAFRGVVEAGGGPQQALPAQMLRHLTWV